MYTNIIDYSSGNMYHSHEYTNPTNQVKSECISYLRNNRFNFFMLYIFLYKLISKDYFHYSVQGNSVIFYYRILRKLTGYYLLGFNLNRYGIPTKIKFYKFVSKLKRFIAYGFDLSSLKLSRMDSFKAYSKPNLTIVYRDEHNIYICLTGVLLHHAENYPRLARVIDRVIEKYNDRDR